ncbi:MAG: addiction module protein [bacterium]|nr:addiction module protein [bacterium]
MSPTSIKLLEDALQLPDRDRADLAARLIDSLDSRVDDDAPTEWEAEVARRMTELDNGSVASLPWPEARRQIMKDADG